MGLLCACRNPVECLALRGPSLSCNEAAGLGVVDGVRFVEYKPLPRGSEPAV